MSENSRSKREAYTPPDNEKEDGRIGHDAGERHRADDKESSVSRTQREASVSQEDEKDTITRTSRTGSGARNPSSSEGNLSETSRSASSSPSDPAGRNIPGTPPIGCARTAGMLLFLATALVSVLSRRRS